VAQLAARHPLVVDLMTGLVVAKWYLAAVLVDNELGRPLTRWDFVAAGGGLTLITLRRRWPRTVLGLSVAAAAVSMAAHESRAAAIPGVAIAAYTVATRSTGRTAWLLGGSAALLSYGASGFWPGTVWAGTPWWAQGNIGVLFAVLMAVAIGDAVRTQRASVAAAEERARRAEDSREQEAHRRVIEERLRIARELHDVVAHRLALISVQAGVATHLMHSRPEQATAALGHVRQAANTAVTELGTVVSVLRQDGDPDPTTLPAPGLADLPGLLDTVAATGLRVRFRQDEPARTLPAAADLAAYRIIQESLTNAHKYGAGGTADLHLAYRDDGVTIEVSNPVRAPGRDSATAGTRHGLIGMRERATALGGALRAGPISANIFAVRAFVPATPDRAAE
jgi:signal transduction histidine kinase